ncbi:MAG TPA: ABC transporter permease [Acidothermaceae bacterium]|nr:ABC transporter permease [Acidothermaceae bacterium]
MTTIALPRRRLFPAWGLTLAGLVAAELIYFTLTTRHFAGHGSGMLALTEQFSPTGLLALGLAVVILTGNIDLSAGAAASLSAVVMGVELQHGWSVVLAALVALAVGTLVGLFNGLVITLLGIDSLLVTLATQFIATSLATSIGGENPPYGFSKSFLRLGTGTIGGVPIDLIVFVVLALFVVALVTRTTFGRSLTLIGYSRSAAEYSGITTRRTLTLVFTMSGTFAGIAGVVLAAYYNSARADTGTTLLLPAITMVVLGGVDIFGGRGRVGEVIIAVFLLGYLTQGLLIEGYSSLTATMVTGILLIAALVFKVWLGRGAGESFVAAAHRLFVKRSRPSRA